MLPWLEFLRIALELKIERSYSADVLSTATIGNGLDMYEEKCFSTSVELSSIPSAVNLLNFGSTKYVGLSGTLSERFNIWDQEFFAFDTKVGCSVPRIVSTVLFASGIAPTCRPVD